MSSSDGPYHALRSEYARVLRALDGLPMSLCSGRCARTSVAAHLVLDLPWDTVGVVGGGPGGLPSGLSLPRGARRPVGATTVAATHPTPSPSPRFCASRGSQSSRGRQGGRCCSRWMRQHSMHVNTCIATPRCAPWGPTWSAPLQPPPPTSRPRSGPPTPTRVEARRSSTRTSGTVVRVGCCFEAPAPSCGCAERRVCFEVWDEAFENSWKNAILGGNEHSILLGHFRRPRLPFSRSPGRRASVCQIYLSFFFCRLL